VFEGICRSVTLSNYLEKVATDEQRAQGLDIADFLMEFVDEPENPRKKSPEEWTDDEVLEHMVEKNPQVKTLMDELDLTLCK
jgi:hypothetical protein